uniref:Retrovirus-related Pol polyprotein from transposon TNT 1-94 n=1 Tax=Tanacetum cinerariifolium TaxID=118510 RepID=A0A6L2LNK8_TANCI|nr:retrovirus-related Pol polyprotein from transposon TNT 1-94 [Tanacetum cinerariifolium]
MAQNEDNIFQVDQCDALDSYVDEAPTAQAMFMANLSSSDPVYDEAGSSYDSDTLFEVQDHDNCLDNINESHKEHEINNDVQPNDVVDSDIEDTSNSIIISYEQYVQDNEDQVVHSDVSSVPNDVVMIITNDIYEQDAQCVALNNAVNAPLTAELVRYKESAKVYEKRAQFELIERELMIDTHMRMIIKYCNVKEESLQKKLYYVKMQLNSTLNHNKLIREEVSTLKQEFKQKENKLLEEFLDMKHLKEKVEDKLYKKDQSLQTVHILCKPKSFYDEVNRVAICYKNPFYLSKAKQVQPALYNGHEIFKTNHARALVHNLEDTLEIAETTRKHMIKKIKDPECVKKKAKALKEKAKSAKPIIAMTVYPPNTPAKLVPKVLPTKSQGIQKALVNKIKEIKEVFDQMEAEVDQHVIDKKYDEIERKNLLIENENLIAKCLSKDVFYTATDFVLTVFRFSDMHDAYAVAQKLRELKAKISRLEKKHSEADLILDFKALDSQNKDLSAKFNALQDLNEHFRVENKKVKQHYKELYDLIKITRTKTTEKTTSLLTEIKTIKAQIKGKTKCITMPDPMKPKVLAPVMYAINVEPIPPQNRNNREVHLEYLKHLKESVRTLREIVEEAMVEKPLDSSLASAYLCTKHSQELLECVIGTCSKDFNKKDRKIATAPLNRKKRVTFVEPVAATERKFNLGERCLLTRFTESKVVHIKQPKSVSTSDIVKTEILSNTSQKPLTSSEESAAERRCRKRNGTLVEATRTMLIFFKASMFLRAEAVATACYTQNRSLIHIRKHVVKKTAVPDNGYGYTYLKEIVLRIADYKEYKILESDFKNLHPNDFEDMYLLHLQGKLNHLSGSDKDASDFLFKEDYTIVSKPRAVIYIDRNDQKKMMRETEVHKFSDGTLNRILDKMDHMVKDFKLFTYNPAMETRIWSEDDRMRSKEFMEVIEKRLQIRRIFRSLESFVSKRLRDVDYRLIQRTK